MNLLKKAACLTLTGCMIISSCCISFAETDTPRRDKDAIEVSQEELDLMNEIRTQHKAFVKEDEANDYTQNRTESIQPRIEIFEECENNDTFSKADLLYLGEGYKGWIDSEDDVDIFEIRFKEDGNATFELWSIPRDCDYDLFIYDEDYKKIASSRNSGYEDEIITIPVIANSSYYVWIESYDGYDTADSYYVDVTFSNSKPIYAFSLGVDFTGHHGEEFIGERHDTTNDAEVFSGDMEKIGFESVFYDVITSNDWDDTLTRYSNKALLEADVLMLAGHGNKNGIYFNESDRGGRYATGVKAGPGEVTTLLEPLPYQTTRQFTMAGLSDYDVSNTVLAVFCACKTAEGGDSSFAKLASNNHGIDCIVAWNDKIEDPDAEKWLDYFGYYLSRGETIRMSAYYANNKGNYKVEDTIVGALEIINEEYDSFDVSLKDYVQDSSARNLAMDDQDINEKMSNLLGKKVSPEKVRKLEEDAIDCELYAVTDSVNYSVEDKNLDEVIAYIQDNFDENFDINQYEVITDMSNVTCNGDTIETSISLKLKYGDFVTTDGYYVVVKDGEVDMIFVNGEPQISSERTIQPRSWVDEEVLKEDALKEVVLCSGEKVEVQRVLKKYDTEPYYIVVTEIVNESNGIDRMQTYEYR